MEGHYWEENGHSVKYENFNSNDESYARAGDGQLNFSTGGHSDDEGDYGVGSYLKKGKVQRQQDPMSHRIIEKRRRDRMNNCLADLSRLIPPQYLKKGRGRVEKTEIIEMAIRHLKYLQDRPQLDRSIESVGEQWGAGFQECVGEAARFLMQRDNGLSHDSVCLQLVAHLQAHFEMRTKGNITRDKLLLPGSSSEASSSSGSYTAGVIHHTRPSHYDNDHYSLDSDKPDISRTEEPQMENASEASPSDGKRQVSPSRLRNEPEANDEYLHSYKFKNSIERRFSRSQDCEAHDMSVRSSKSCHKRRRMSVKCADIHTHADTSNHTDTEHPHTQMVPIFALNSAGKYYIPLSVEQSCISRYLPACAAQSHVPPPLHSVTLHVNFQPCAHCRANDNDPDWKPM